MRMYFAIIADLAIEPDEYLRVYDRSGTDSCVVFDYGMCADQAAVADDCAGTDDAIRPQKDAFADDGFRVHGRGRMALSPLSEAVTLLIEIMKQSRHSHRDIGNGKAAGIAIFAAIEGSAQVRRNDQDRRPMQQRFRRLFRSTCIDQASVQRLFRNFAMTRPR